jgi:hypothetical protein
MVENVRTTEKTHERAFVAASGFASMDLSRWTELEIRVAKDTVRVFNGSTEILPETKVPDADFRGPVALVLRTGAEIQFRWVDVVSSKPPRPPESIAYDSKAQGWNRSGKLEPIDGGVAAVPENASWATIPPPGQAYAVETFLSVQTSGPGYALVFFRAFDRHCALAVGMNEKNQEKLSVGLFGDLKGRFIYYSNNEHFLAKPSGVSLKKKNRYRIEVLPGSVEIRINGERVFFESRDTFVQKIDYAKGIGDKGGIRAREMNTGLGAWDIANREARGIRAEFTGIAVRAIR